jgi:hypothetical protein
MTYNTYMANLTHSLTRPDFWGVLVCQTLREEGLDLPGFDLSEYPWWCEQMEELEEAYEAGDLSPVDTRVEIFNTTMIQYAEALEVMFNAPSATSS